MAGGKTVVLHMCRPLKCETRDLLDQFVAYRQIETMLCQLLFIGLVGL